MNKITIALLALIVLAVSCSGSPPVQPAQPVQIVQTDISTFLTNPSDQFLVDMDVVALGHPFLGVNANEPHPGAHVHFQNLDNLWPQGGSAPENYIPIYAVADGVISDVDFYFPVGPNYRYGINLEIGQSAGISITFDYGIEPLIDPGDPDFYKDFILVAKGDAVSKGDIIAYMYLSPGELGGAHIHFHLRPAATEDFKAPAIFSTALVQAFHDKWGLFGFDGGIPMPACMGYMISRDENPFEAKQKNCL